MKQTKYSQNLIEYMDELLVRILEEDEEANPFEALTTAEEALIAQELAKCKRDFAYAAGNYFWLSQTKTAEKMLFDIDQMPAQEILLSLIFDFWKKGLPARIMVHKARQLGISTVCEGLMGWKMLFFRDQIAMIVAQDPKQAAHLLGIATYIYDNVPWWMHPMQGSREIKELLVLDNPDERERRKNPGLHNYLIANACNKMSSFGQGKALHCLHVSEVASFRPENRAEEIIDGDLLYALPDAPGTFAVMESKPKGVGGYWYGLWQDYSKQGIEAQFYPLFIPCFAEKNRRRKAPAEFVPSEEEVKMSEDYSIGWHKCVKCGKMISTAYVDHPVCLYCGSAEHNPIFLDNDQVYWYRHMKEAVEKDRSRYRKFLQEMAVTAEEGFQVSGEQVFPDDALHYLERTVNWRGKRGFFDENLEFHYAERTAEPDGTISIHCPICTQNHTDEEYPLFVWEKPVKGYHYVFGIDVAEGGEEGDWSVIHGLRIGYGLEPDTQVLEWRGQVDAVELAQVVYLLGKAYNNALVAMEVGTASGGGELCQWELTGKMGYQNIFRWKNYDSKNPVTNKFGWVTNARTRPMLITNGIRWLRGKIWKPQSPNFLKEVRTFVRDEEHAKAKAVSGTFDDVVIASLMAIFCAHESDFDPNTNRLMIPKGRLRGVDGAQLNWTCECACGNTWDVADPRGEICMKCGSPVLNAKRKGTCSCGKFAEPIGPNSANCKRCGLRIHYKKRETIDFNEQPVEVNAELPSYECL
jgi:DNA-directed RNA polymerase subunit RPC12/RpoP